MNYCKECCKNFSDERAYYRHLNSKSHNKRVNSVSELYIIYTYQEHKKTMKILLYVIL